MKNLKLFIVLMILAAIGCGSYGYKNLKYLAFELSGAPYSYTAQTGPVTEINDLSELPPQAVSIIKKTGYSFLGMLLFIGLAAMSVIALIIMHISSELSFYHREKRVYGRDISGTGVTLTLKAVCILLLFIGTAVLVYCCLRLGTSYSGKPLPDSLTQIMQAGSAAKWLYGIYVGAFMLILSLLSLAAAFLYGAYRKRLNKKTGYAERNVNKEDLSWLLDVEYSDDENDKK